MRYKYSVPRRFEGGGVGQFWYLYKKRLDKIDMVDVPENIVFYDGDCGFCNRSVNYVLKHDKTKSIHYASLQSEITKQIFLRNGWPEADLSTFYFYQNGELYEKSRAAFKVVAFFPWYMQWLHIFRIFPVAFRDWIYDQIAKRRRRISKGYCVMPSPEERKLFLG